MLKKFFYSLIIILLNISFCSAFNNFFKSNESSPNFNIEFQVPSYLLNKEENTEIYYCDNSKWDCKINFNLTDEPSKTLSSSKFICEISIFSNLDLDSNFVLEENYSKIINCNPNTLTFSWNINKINFKVLDKTNNSIFTEKNIAISKNVLNGEEKQKLLNFLDLEHKNTLQIIEKQKQEELQNILKNLYYSNESSISSYYSGEARIWDYQNVTDYEWKESLEIPDFSVVFQQPSYIIKTWENEFICDNKYSDCKINLNILSLSLNTLSSKLFCEINWISEIESKKCNPNTVSLWDWENIIKIKVFDENYNFREKILKIQNTRSTISSWSSSSSSSNIISSSSTYSEFNIFEKVSVFLQWNLWENKIFDNSKNEIICDTSSDFCSLNFTSWEFTKKELSSVDFFWDFGNLETFSWKNPKSIKYKVWEYELKLRVTDNLWNKKYFVYKIKVNDLKAKKEEEKEIKSLFKVFDKEFSNFDKSINKEFAKFQKSLKKNFEKGLVWRKTKTKSLVKEEEVKKVNLAKWVSLRTNKQKKNFKISWETFPNSKLVFTFWWDTFNAKSDELWKYEIKINSLKAWNYKVILKVFDGLWNLIWEKSSREIVFEKDYVENMLSYLQPWITKKAKEKSLAKGISLRTSKQKKNFKISWKTFANSKIVFNIWKQKFQTFTNNIWEYELKINNLQVWNYKVLATVFSKSGLILAQKSSRNIKFDATYLAKMATYYLPKEKNKQKVTSLKVQKFVPKIEEVKDLWFNLKIFISQIMLLIMTFWLWFIVLIKKRLI